MKLDKFKNFLWGISFGVCLCGAIRAKDETVIIPIVLMVLIGTSFIINFNKK